MPFPSLTIGRHTVPYPIVQGGMGIRISGANLAAAVANAGGIGVISSVGLGYGTRYFDELKGQDLDGRFFEACRKALVDEIRKARALSPKGIIGVNSMVAARHHDALMRAIATEPIDLLIVGAGLPLNLPRLTEQAPDVALVPIVSSARAARVICRKWHQQYDRLPDGFVVENPRYAGGHLGATVEEINNPAFLGDQALIEVVQFVRNELQQPIPVIAAGGIWDRADVERAIAAGASGVQLGTRFITTEECDAHPNYKAWHLQAQPEDVLLVPSPVGMPGRALRTPFVMDVLHHNVPRKSPCMNCLHRCKYRDTGETYCILDALYRAATGDVANGLVFSGSNAGRSDRLSSVAEVMADLVGVPAALTALG